MVEPLLASPATAANPMRLALIGYGYWGMKVHAALNRNSAFKLARLHVRHPERLSRQQEAALSDVEIHPSADALWTDPSIGSVLIVSPISSHYSLCREALEAGKNVFVEKPMCLQSRQAQELASLANSRGLTLQTDYTWTFSPGLSHARELIAQGWLGKLRSIQVRFHQLGRFREHGVGALLVVHMLSIVQMFTPLSELNWSELPVASTGERLTTTMLAAEGRDSLQVIVDASLDDPIKSRSVSLVGSTGALTFQPGTPGPTVIGQRYSRAVASKGDSLIHPPHSYISDESDNLSHSLHAFAEVIRGDRDSNLSSSVEITALYESLFDSVSRRV